MMTMERPLLAQRRHSMHQYSITWDPRTSFEAEPTCQIDVRSWKSGRHLLVLSLSQFDPEGHLALVPQLTAPAMPLVSAKFRSARTGCFGSTASAASSSDIHHTRL